jgi:hypothetical protein
VFGGGVILVVGLGFCGWWWWYLGGWFRVLWLVVVVSWWLVSRLVIWCVVWWVGGLLDLSPRHAGIESCASWL